MLKLLLPYITSRLCCVTGQTPSQSLQFLVCFGLSGSRLRARTLADHTAGAVLALRPPGRGGGRRRRARILTDHALRARAAARGVVPIVDPREYKIHIKQYMLLINQYMLLVNYDVCRGG